jgi:hypothetical protein
MSYWTRIQLRHAPWSYHSMRLSQRVSFPHRFPASAAPPAPQYKAKHPSVCRDVTNGELTTYEADALVFAVGVTGMQKIVQANPSLGSRPEFQRMMNLRGIDVVSTRLWLSKRVKTQFPANVLAGFDENMGSTYFNLNDLQARSHRRCTCCEFTRTTGL